MYLQVGLTGQQLWGLPRKGPRNSTKSRWGTPPLFPLDGKHGLAQAHRAPPWAAHHGVHSQRPRARCSTKGPSPRDSGRRWHRSAGFQRPGAGEAEQDKAPQAPRCPLWTHAACGVSILTGEWHSSCRAGVLWALAQSLRRRCHTWPWLGHLRGQTPRGPSRGQGAPSDLRTTFIECPPPPGHSAAPDPYDGHREARPSDRWGPV